MEEKKFLVIDGKQTKIKDLTGQRFGKLTVIGFYKIIKNHYYWQCSCCCGSNKKVNVESYNLKKGKIDNCGCLTSHRLKTSQQKVFQKSFYQWCTENNCYEYLDLWDYDLNSILPNEVAFSSMQFMYFKCPKGIHKSELNQIRRLTRIIDYNICIKCNSFAYWGINEICEDFLEKYWDYDKNIFNPWEIKQNSINEIWIKCQEKSYHESYKTTCNNFHRGRRCPYCSSKIINFKDSLGMYLKNENLLNLWSDKNEKNPFKIALNSNKKYWFKCENGIHEDFYKSPNNSVACKFRCPECKSSLGEQKISNYLTDNKIEYIPQYEYPDLIGVNGGLLKFDFYIPILNIVIEYDGEGHYMVIDFSGEGKEKAKEKFKTLKIHDKLKNKYCKNNNIQILRIPYWDFDNIEEILKQELKIN